MKIKNIMIYFIIVVVVLLTFKIPEILLKKDSQNVGLEIYKEIENETTIDFETEKIYLVKAIHDIEEGRTIVISSPEYMYLYQKQVFDINDGLTQKVNDELVKLKESNIIKDIGIEPDKEYRIGLIDKSYPNKEITYDIKNIILSSNSNDINNIKYILNMESKTGKILYIAFNEDNLCELENKQEILENYIKYLNLYIIDDWKYEENEIDKVYTMKSEKAGLKVTLEQHDENIMISIHIF